MHRPYVERRPDTARGTGRRVNIGSIMRIPITLSERAVRDAKAYMANNDPEHAVESLIDSYGNLVADIRRLRGRVRQLDDESAELDEVLRKLREVAKLIDEL